MTALARGFDDPVTEAQAVFQAAMTALSRPGRIQPLRTDLKPPHPLTSEAAAIALALCDHETPFWLDPSLAVEPAVAAFLRFHTGARATVDPGEASFALVASPEASLDLAAFARGTAEFPDRSTTLVFAVADLAEAEGRSIEGPGIPGRRTLRVAPWPEDLDGLMRANEAEFPLGLDVLLVAPGCIAGLPRSTRLAEDT